MWLGHDFERMGTQCLEEWGRDVLKSGDAMPRVPTGIKKCPDDKSQGIFLFSSFQLHQHFKGFINMILFYNDCKLIGC